MNTLILLIEVLDYVAEQERAMIHKRKTEGVAAAKGKHSERKKVRIPR